MVVYKMFERASTSELWSFATIIILGLILFGLSGYLKSVILSFKLSGPPIVPFIGNCLIIKEKDWLQKRAATAFHLYGSLVRIWIFLFPFFVVLQPEDLQVILSSKKNTSKVFIYRWMHNFLGNGLITSSGLKWEHNRRLIQPTFHMNILEKFIGTFADASQAFYQNLNSKDSEINISHFVNNCIIDILNEAVLGVPVKKKNSDMDESPFRKGKIVFRDRITKPWLLWDSIYSMTKLASDEISQKNRLNEFTRSMIQKRRILLQNNEITEKKCLLDYMIEISDNNKIFTEDDIVNEACTFMLAGQDSVGAAVAICLFLLAQNTECQQKCIEEIDRIFDDNRSPTMHDLREMRYLEMCIKEALRLYPSVPIIARKTGEDIRLGKYTLPTGSNILICPYATHRLPHIYPEPEKFNPDRFTPENCEKRHPYSYIPFSAGPRYCIGNKFAIMEMKTVISRLLRTYELQPVPGKTTLEATFRVTLRCSGGLWIRLKQRSNMTDFSN